MQEALTANFSGGVWVSQAVNLNEFGSKGPTLVMMRSNRCEGSCADPSVSGGARLTASVVQGPQQWRQPLCDPNVRGFNEHQGCVPVVFLMDRAESVVIRTVAFTWHNLFSQWLSPLVVSAILMLVLLYLPTKLGIGGSSGGGETREESKALQYLGATKVGFVGDDL